MAKQFIFGLICAPFKLNKYYKFKPVTQNVSCIHDFTLPELEGNDISSVLDKYSNICYETLKALWNTKPRASQSVRVVQCLCHMQAKEQLLWWLNASETWYPTKKTSDKYLNLKGIRRKRRKKPRFSWNERQVRYCANYIPFKVIPLKWNRHWDVCQTLPIDCL